jgi:hypothetical protein
MRLAPHNSSILAAMLLALAGCEIAVGPPSEDQSKPRTIQVPPAQAAVMGKGIEVQEQRGTTTGQNERPADQAPVGILAQREGKSKRGRDDAERPEAGQASGTGERRALDRIGAEIRDALSLRKTLVVWLIESTTDSKKLAEDANDLIVKQMQELSSGQPNPLEVAAIRYGSEQTILISAPTGSADEVRRALGAAKSSQDEKVNVFAALKRAADEYLPYRKRGYEVIFVIVGASDADDLKAADEPIAALKRAAVQVYGFGPTVPFGVPGRGPRQTSASSSANRKVESLYPERIQLALSGGQSSGDLTDSGYGPFALERICRQTGGKFLRVSGARPPGWKNDPDTGDISVDLSAKYAPDYVSDGEYQRLLAENKCRVALHKASLLPPAESLPLGQPTRLDFPKPKDEAALAKDITKAQQVAAERDLAIQKLYDTLIPGESDRSKLTGARWQAGYDLAMGQVLAAKARLDGYNAMLAVLKQGKNFTNPDSTRWVLEPADEIAASSALDKMAKNSRNYLNRVITEHPGTPWAELAQRELRHPAGWKLVER